MWCLNCGTPLPPAAQKCPTCAEPVPAVPAPRPRAAVEPAERRARLAFRFDSLLTLGALFEARELAREAASQEEEAAERAVWVERQSSLTARIRQELRIRIVECQGNPMPDLLSATYALEDASCWLGPSGERIYLVTSYGRWVLIRIYDVAEHRIRTLVSLHAPEEIERPDIIVEEDRLWIIDARARVLELSLSTWEALSWRAETPLCTGEDEELNRVTFTPSTRTLWLSMSKGAHCDIRTLRLGERGDGPRLVDEAESASLLTGSKGLQVITTDLHGGHLFSAEEELLGDLPDDFDITHAAELPGGKGLLLLTSTGEDLDAPLALVQAAPDGTCGSPVQVEGSSSSRPSALAISREAQLAFVYFNGRERDSWLAAFALTPRGPEQVYRIPVEHQASLVQDVLGRRVLLLSPTEDDTAVIALGSEAPRVSGVQRVEAQLPVVAGYTLSWCGLPPVSERMGSVAQFLTRQPEESRGAALQEAIRKHEQDAEALLALSAALEQKLEAPLGAQIARFTWDRHAGHPAVELHRASVEGGNGHWSTAQARVAGIDASALDRRQTRHLHHLRGLAHYHLGRPEDARTELQLGLTLDDDGECRLKPWLTLVAGVLDPTPLTIMEPGLPYLHQYVRSIRAADELLARKNVAGAVKVLDRWPVWRCDDLQGLARLAQAWLFQDPLDEVGRFRKQLVLAAFTWRQGESFRGWQLDIPADLAWNEARLTRIAQQAREWLDQVG